ncbi:sulfatase [Shewanella electrodiphila]|uniref:Sulfatase n=1 Tax=Shewanella electrodiphila TaxID=934143 RepID=A0ABT0KMI5_9GAMM|nr:sulfatase [Shewanella electrodiphila]MCL1045060.1 sulfatase [Shewanella electrodiphila]
MLIHCQSLYRYSALAACLLLGSACHIATEKPLANEQLTKKTITKKPNVLFILVDDLGYSDIAAYNDNTFYATPHIDQLAKEGVQFTNGYAANPVCSPSRYAALTGRHPTRINATDWFHVDGWPHRSEKFNPANMLESMPLEEKTMAESFSENGYSTAFLGKWHLGDDESVWPEHQGFDVNIGGMKYGQPPNGYFSPYKNPRLTDGPDGEYLTDRLTDESINLLETYAKQDNPFFMYLSFYTVHTPLQAPDELVKQYEVLSQKMKLSNDFLREEQIWPTDEERLVRVKQSHAIYAAMISKMDSNVGRVLSKLKNLGLDDNTIVVFTSDNGGLSTSEGSPTSNLPLRGGKGWLYEGGIRVPLIIKAPNAKSNGRQLDTPVIATDFYPTLLSLTGLSAEPDKHIDGVSLAPLLTGGDINAKRPLFFHYPHYSNQGGFPGAAVRVGDWKLIERFEDGQTHLYNLKHDIAEQNDLVSTEPVKAKALTALLHDWYREVDANFLNSKNNKSPWTPSQ